MRLVRFEFQGQECAGLLRGNTVIDLARLGICPPDARLEHLLFNQRAELLELQSTMCPAAAELPLDAVSLLTPVASPGKIIGAASNYHDACRASGKAPPSAPVLFAKYNNTLLRPGGGIALPPASQQVTYEGELALIIGRRARHVHPEDAISYLAGVTVANDISASDLIRSDGNFFRGKNFDAFLPLGPSLVTLDEIPDLNDLTITLTVDGVIRQHSSTREMVFKSADLISYLSNVFTLEPGDVILTGTPAGVAVNHDPAAWLQDGSTLTIEIGGVGKLINHVMKGMHP
jgi:2,4-diketo-3-deoxy-L-fuconate hydrolase